MSRIRPRFPGSPRPPRGPGLLLWLAGIPALAGCGESVPSPEAGVTRFDSAGVTIVSSAAPAWGLETGWRASETPALVIGRLDGPDELQLFDVTDATVLADGRIAVANSGTSEIRFYDAAGEYLSRAGGEGDGPGEFRALASIHRMDDDSILAWDRRLLRVSVFSPDGTLARSFRLEPPGEGVFPSLEDRFEDGSLLVSAPRLVSPADLPDDFGVVGTPFPYMRYSPEGVPEDSIDEFSRGRSLIRTQERGFSFFTIPFGPPWQVVAGRSAVYVSTGDQIEVRSPEAAWRPTAIRRRSFDTIPVTDALLDREFGAEWEDFENADYVRLAREAYDAMPLPEHVAAFDRLLVDPGGFLWARRYLLSGRPSAAWSVFDPQGEWLGDVALPAGLQVYEIGDDYVLGRERDELAIEQVLMYRIEKG